MNNLDRDCGYVTGVSLAPRSPRKMPHGPLAEMETFAKQMEYLLWGMFLNFVICRMLIPVGSSTADSFSIPYRLMNLISYAWNFGILYLIGKNWRFLSQSAISLNRKFTLFYPYMMIVAFSCVQGLICYKKQEFSYLHYFFWNVIPYFMAISSFGAGGAWPFRRRVLRLMVIQAPIAGLVALYTAVFFPITEGREGVGSVHSFAAGLASFVIFMLGMLPYFKFYKQILVMLGVFGYYFLMFSYQGRAQSLILFIIIPLVLLVGWARSGLLHGRYIIHTLILFILSLLVFVYIILASPGLASFFKERVETAWEETVKRWFLGSEMDIQGMEESVAIEMETSRGAEAREFIETSTIRTWLIGHGFGVGWRSEVMAEGGRWQMVHFGPLNFVLNGGLGFSIIFIIIVLSGIIRSWVALPKDPLAIGCFCYLMAYFPGFFTHGQFAHNYDSYILWLILGLAFGLQTKQRVGV